MVEGGPHGTIVAQPENQEITRGFFCEDSKSKGDFIVGLLRGDVGSDVMEECLHGGRRELVVVA